VEYAAHKGDDRDAEAREHAREVAHVHRPDTAARQRLVVDALEDRGQCRDGHESEREPPLILVHSMHDVEADHVSRNQARWSAKDLPREFVRSCYRAHFVPPVDGLRIRLGVVTPSEQNYFTILYNKKQ
jgi:hypothetical protein